MTQDCHITATSIQFRVSLINDMLHAAFTAPVLARIICLMIGRYHYDPAETSLTPAMLQSAWHIWVITPEHAACMCVRGTVAEQPPAHST